MELNEFYAYLSGYNVNQNGFYTEFFRILFKDGRVFISDLSDWKERTRQKYTKRLTEIKAIELKRSGYRGAAYYQMTPEWWAKTSELWKLQKKHLR